MPAVPPILPAERPASRVAWPPPPPAPNFADLLRRGPTTTHGVLARPVAPPALRADPPPRDGIDRDSDDEAPTEAQRAARAAAARAGTRPAPQREKAAATAKPPEAAGASVDSAASGEDRPALRRAADDIGSGAVQAADLRDWLAALQFDDASTTAETASQDAAAGADGAASLGSGGGGATHSTSAGDDPRGDESPAKGGAGIAATGGARTAAPAAERAAGAPAEAHAAKLDTPAARDATAPLFSGAAGAVPRGFDAATLAPIAMPTPLYSPDFAQALGAQVSLLARDGVQQAELHLNPAEMGPISVQIEIDGKEARVDFGADAAVTREVIERGLPELASALREQGLTLSGGGVFERAPQRREPGDERHVAGRSKRFTSATAGSVTPRLPARPAALGLLDLYV